MKRSLLVALLLAGGVGLSGCGDKPAPPAPPKKSEPAPPPAPAPKPEAAPTPAPTPAPDAKKDEKK